MLISKSLLLCKTDPKKIPTITLTKEDSLTVSCFTVVLGLLAGLALSSLFFAGALLGLLVLLGRGTFEGERLVELTLEGDDLTEEDGVLVLEEAREVGTFEGEGKPDCLC